jgi:UDP-2,3-diacylglucosamine pyrophosphatase LpxH
MKPILTIGDIHGKWDALFQKIQRLDLRDFTLICVGDLGVGFKDSHTKEIRALQFANDFFVARDIQFLSIRGNHDNPAYFNGEIQTFSNLRLVPDYHVETINDKKFLFVGGAISIDRKLRKLGFSYWSDETFKLDHLKIQRCDVLITHSAPTWNGPIEKSGIMAHYCQKDETLWDECMTERKQHDILIKLTGAKRHYCGHFHECLMATVDDCTSTILDELQILEIQ